MISDSAIQNDKASAGKNMKKLKLSYTINWLEKTLWTNDLEEATKVEHANSLGPGIQF